MIISIISINFTYLYLYTLIYATYKLLGSKTVTAELTLECRRKLLFKEVIFVKITEKNFYDKFLGKTYPKPKMTNHLKTCSGQPDRTHRPLDDRRVVRASNHSTIVGVKNGHDEVNI